MTKDRQNDETSVTAAASVSESQPPNDVAEATIETTNETIKEVKGPVVAIPNLKLMRIVADEKKTQFPHILLFNSLRNTGLALQGVGQLSTLHYNLMLIHGLMAGFQYIALENNGNGEAEAIIDWDILDKTIFTIRAVGFGMSLLGMVLSLVAIEYFTSIMGEETEFQVRGVLKYQPFFLLSDKLAVTSGVTLAVACNLIIHNHQLPIVVPVVINVLSLVALIMYLIMFAKIILHRQDYGAGPGRHLYTFISR